MAPIPGCRCKECWGLREHMAMVSPGREFGLPAAPGHRSRKLRVIPDTGIPTHEPECDGTMTCQCPACAESDRIRRLKKATVDVRQPWEPRPSRRAA